MNKRHPLQLDLPGMEPQEKTAPGMELTFSELILLTQLAETGRDLLRGHLLTNQIPIKEVFNVKAVVTRADRLLDKLADHLATASETQN